MAEAGSDHRKIARTTRSASAASSALVTSD
jgi:hypothetical protein